MVKGSSSSSSSSSSGSPSLQDALDEAGYKQRERKASFAEEEDIYGYLSMIPGFSVESNDLFFENGGKRFIIGLTIYEVSEEPYYRTQGYAKRKNKLFDILDRITGSGAGSRIGSRGRGGII